MSKDISCIYYPISDFLSMLLLYKVMLSTAGIHPGYKEIYLSGIHNDAGLNCRKLHDRRKKGYEL